MTVTIENQTVGTRAVAHAFSWNMDFELRDAKRPFGPEDKLVAVREIVSGDQVYGFLVLLGLRPDDKYLAVSEVEGDEQWHTVQTNIPTNDDDAVDEAGRAVIADRLFRTEQKHNA